MTAVWFADFLVMSACPNSEHRSMLVKNVKLRLCDAKRVKDGQGVNRTPVSMGCVFRVHCMVKLVGFFLCS